MNGGGVVRERSEKYIW